MLKLLINFAYSYYSSIGSLMQKFSVINSGLLKEIYNYDVSTDLLLSLALEKYYNKRWNFKLSSTLGKFNNLQFSVLNIFTKDTTFFLIYYYFFNLFYFILVFNFTILYWFCHISKWIRHRYTCVPHHEPYSLPPPHTIPLGRPSAPAPSIQYRASNLDWRLVS